jgi:hypothetical protein
LWLALFVAVPVFQSYDFQMDNRSGSLNGVWIRAWVGLVAGLVFAGCATGQRTDWQARMGQYSYDDSVKEYGPPLRKESTTDGTTVAEWLLHRGQVYSTPTPAFGMGYWGRWGWAGGGAVSMNSTPDHYLQLQFGPDGQLTKWKRVYK